MARASSAAIDPAAPLAGQRVLVTGATGDIGAAITDAVAAAGGVPIVHYARRREAAEAQVARLCSGYAVGADLATAEGPEQLWNDSLAAAGAIDALVLNAGSRTEIDAAADRAEWHAGWARDMQLNVQAAADLCRLACPYFADRGHGRVIGMASRAAQRGYAWQALPYGASKAALINLMQSVAINHGPAGVVATAIAPGWVDSAMAQRFIAEHGEDAALAEIPTRRMTALDELGALVAFFLRPDQIAINGATIDLNGGSHIR